MIFVRGRCRNIDEELSTIVTKLRRCLANATCALGVLGI